MRTFIKPHHFSAQNSNGLPSHSENNPHMKALLSLAPCYSQSPTTPALCSSSSSTQASCPFGPSLAVLSAWNATRAHLLGVTSLASGLYLEVPSLWRPSRWPSVSDIPYSLSCLIFSPCHLTLSNTVYVYFLFFLFLACLLLQNLRL